MEFKSFIKLSCLFLLVSLNVNSNEKNTYTPKADAGFDQFARLNETIKLNASNSTDKDGNRLTYQWRIVNKPEKSTTSISEPDGVTAELKIDQPGSYEIELFVSDGKDSSSVDSLLIDTNDTAPQLSEFHDQKVLQGESAFIDGSTVQDPDGDDITFDWTLERKPQKSKAIIQDSNSKSPVITTDAQGKYSVRLHVSDYATNKTSNLFNIFAVDSFDRTNKALGCVLDRIFFDGFDGLFNNSAPIADVGSDKMGVIGQIIALDGSLSSDIDLDSLTYSWSLLTSPVGSSTVISDNDQMIASLSPDVTGDYVAQLIVNDGCLDSDPDSALVTISVNQSPLITSSPDTSIRESQAYSYQVIATDPEAHELDYELTVSPAGSTIDMNGLITWTSLAEGSYPVTVLVTDEYGATDSQSYNIEVVANNAPIIQSFPLSSAEQDYDYSYQLVVTDADDDNIAYQLINPVAGMTVSIDGLTTWVPDAAGSYQVEVQVDDGYGGTDTQTFTLEVIELPPNPEDIAPTLSKTDFPPFIDTINFLYDSVPPVQVGIPVDSIHDYRAAVMKGRVLDAEGAPLPGVKISINNHSEFGYTYSRINGEYDLVVNGGGTLTVNYSKGGFITSQRDVLTPWEDFVYSEDVVLIRLDNQLTKLDLTDTLNDFQVVQGSEVTDNDGTRQATLLFPSGIQASLQFEDGSTQPISDLSVRATEFTVGSLGLERMPGNLPPASGYTYAVELSVDEAIFQQAANVNFDQSIPLYVENFIGFPTGTKAPLASYDRKNAYWIPELGGVVISINRIENDSAIIDVSNDGVVNDATQNELDELEISNEELAVIASLYQEGQSLWRTTVNHFTPWDINWPYIPPTSLTEPPEQPTPVENPEILEDDSPEDEPEDLDMNTDCTGCNINAQNRTIEEEIPLIGTDHSLHYSSSSVFPSSGFDEFVIPLVGDTVPEELDRIELVIDGEILEFEPSANLTYTYVWDGTDHYDRTYHSKTTAYNVHYYFPLIYSPGISQAEFDRSFGVYEELNLNPSFNVIRNELELKLSKHNKIKLYRKYNTFASSNILKSGGGAVRKAVRDEQLKLGGWAIKDHHVYNPYQRILIKGDGFKRKVQAFIAQIENPNVSNHPGPTDISEIDETWAVTVAPNNEIYFADRNKGHIVKIGENGNAVRVAGRVHEFFPNCNEEPIEQESALDVCLTSVQDIKVAPNGDIYYVYERRVRKIDRNGIVTTVAGNGSFGSSPDGTPATEAGIPARYIAFDKHGTLFISVGWGIRKVDTDGNIQTVAGGSEFGFGVEAIFENILATETAMFNASGIVISDAGSIFVADTGHECVRQVTPDGWIYTVNGSTECFYEELSRSGGGGHILESAPRAVDIDSNGALYILESMYDWQGSQNKIVKIHPFGMFEVLLDSTQGFSGDGGLLNNAQINTALNFSLNQADELFIADTFNDRIRKVDSFNVIETIAGGSDILTPPIALKSLKNQSVQRKGGAGSILMPGSLVVVSLDGKLIYEFSEEGAHRRTIDSATGKISREFIYDSLGQLVSIKDENELVTHIERLNGTSASAVISPYGKRTEFEYYPSGLLKDVTDPMQNLWKFEYSSNNQLSAFTDRKNHRYDYSYNEFGLLNSDLNPIGGGWQITTLNDVEGSNRVTMTSGEGRQYSFFKDSFRTGLGEFILLEDTRPDSTIHSHLETIHDSIKDVTAFTDGTIIQSGDSKGSRFGFQYYWDNDIEVLTPSGLRQHTWNSFANDYDGNYPEVITPVPEYTRTSLIQNQPWVSEYKQSFGTNGGTRSISPELRVTLNLYDADKKLQHVETTGFNSVNIEYDNDGRVSRMFSGENADLRENIFTYYNSGTMQGELESITNTIGDITKFEYDLNGRIIKQVFPDLSEVVYQYDASGNLEAMVPFGNQPHGFSYNGISQKASYNPPLLTGISITDTTYEYNLDGQLTKVNRPDGKVINFAYGASTGKLMSKNVGADSYTYNYDLNTGQVSQVTSPDSITSSLTYDGFLPTSTTWSGEVNGSVSRIYDNLFRVTSREVNSSNPVTYSYDNDNLLITAGDLSIMREAQKAGFINGTTLNQVTTTRNYNDFGELDNYTADFNGMNIFESVFTRDKLGRAKMLLQTTNGILKSFEYDYDSLGRLVELKEDGIITKEWGYDANGNRSHENSVQIATYDDQDRLLTYGTSTYQYNNNGDLESKTTGVDSNVYEYDAFGNLQEVSLPNGDIIEYVVDSRNRRVGKKVNGSLVKGWVYKDKLNPIVELDSMGNVVARFIYGDKPNIPSYIIKGADSFRIISNHLGSPVLVVNAADGTVVQELEYDVWGNIVNDSNPEFQPFGFAGGLYDKDTGFTRFGHRGYDPQVSRWTNKDPIRFMALSSNLYTYAFNDPVNFIDSDGLEAIVVNFEGYPINTETSLGTLPLFHSGVVAIDENGNTRYFEYGRYDKENRGLVREKDALNLEINENGLATTDSIKKLLDDLSDKYGKDKPYNISWFDTPFEDVVNFAEEFKNDPNRPDYNLLLNNCTSFANNAAKGGN